MTTPSATGLRPGYQVTISDGTHVVGIMAHTADTPSARAIRRLPQGTGVERKSIVQNSFMGGRGGYRLATDATKFADSGAAWTMVDGYWISGPLAHRMSLGARRLMTDSPNTGAGVCWKQVTGPYAKMARKITVSASMVTISSLRVLIRRVGAGTATGHVYVHDDNAGVPGVLRIDYPLTVDMDDGLGRWLNVPVGVAYGAGIVCWIVVADTAVPAIDAADRWEVGIHDATSTAHDGWYYSAGAWHGADAYAFYWELDNGGGVNFTPHFFEYQRMLYCATQPDDGSAGKLFINGYRGVAHGAGQTVNSLEDTHAAFPVGALADKTLLFIAGKLKGKWTGIGMPGGFTNTATILYCSALPVAPEADVSAYVVLGDDEWLEITGTGLTGPVTDVAVAGGGVFFAQGPAIWVRRMREYASGGNWVREFTDDDVKVDFVIHHTDSSVSRLYLARNSDVMIARGNVPVWGANTAPDWWKAAGDSESPITGLCEYDNTIYVAKEDRIGLMAQGGDQWAEVPVALNAGRDEANGRNLTGWNTNLYFPFLDGFERLYGQVVDDIGCNRGEGLPANRRGKVCDFKPVLQYGFAALCNPTGFYNGISSIMATTSPGGDWHELYRAVPQMPPWDLWSDNIRALFFQSVPGFMNRLWFNEGADMHCLYLARDTHSPILDERAVYAWSSYITTSWIDGDTQDLDHFFNQLRVFSRVNGTLPGAGTGAPITGQWIEVDYQVDNDTAWTACPGKVTSGPFQVLTVGAGNVKGKRIRFRFRGYTSDPTKPMVMNSYDLRIDVMHEVLYDFVLDFQQKDRIMLLSGADSRTKSAAALAQLQSWQEDATVLTWRCVIPAFDNVRGHIDPVSLVPRSWRKNNVEYSGSLTFKQTG